MRVVPRTSNELRCAYCHGDIDQGPSCERCSTTLHEDCWVLAGTCPTLGCSRFLKIPLIRVLPRRVQASIALLIYWLVAFSGVVFTLDFVVPAFQKMFTETGLSLPALTELLVSVSYYASSIPGMIVSAAIFAGSVAAFRKHRAHRGLRHALVFSSLGATAFFPFALMALFLPCVQTCQKL